MPIVLTVMVRLQTEVGAKRIWRSSHVARPVGSHMETRHRFV